MPSALTKKQIDWAYDKWCEGYTMLEIANALYVCEKTIRRALSNRVKVKKPLEYDLED